MEIQGGAVEGGNQYAEEVDHVVDITAITALPVSNTEVLVPNATPVSATVGEETLDDCHVAEVTHYKKTSPMWLGFMTTI